MKEIKTQKDLKAHLKTPEAFSEEFNYKGFGIWWNNENVVGVQHHNWGFFRCDPGTDKEYLEFSKLSDKHFANYEWILS